MTQQDLFYPEAPGHKEKDGTSQQAAEEIKPKAQTIRENLNCDDLEAYWSRVQSIDEEARLSQDTAW